MPALSRAQENTISILNWFITVNGTLVDAYEVGYQVYDISSGLPGVQVFPITPGNWETVTSSPGKFSTGSYYAYDNGNVHGYTPPITENIGTHRIYWRWKITSDSGYQTGAEDFEVIVQSSGSTGDTYITIQDVRDEGLSDATIYPDAKVLSYIEIYQEILERACRQWFKPKNLTIKVDGNDSTVMPFGVPIINVDYLKINNSADELDPSYYTVHNSITYPDDRRNPRISLVNDSEYRDIFTAPMQDGMMRFRKGRRNQEIKCTLGYVEEDMSTPKPIKRALLKLVIEKLGTPLVMNPDAPVDTPPPILGTILEEWTDGHRLKYSQAGAPVSARSPYLTGITNDQEIIEIIKMFRAPIGCATPAHPSYR